MISLRQLGDCEARELIKAKVENATEWATLAYGGRLFSAHAF